MRKEEALWLRGYVRSMRFVVPLWTSVAFCAAAVWVHGHTVLFSVLALAFQLGAAWPIFRRMQRSDLTERISPWYVATTLLLIGGMLLYTYWSLLPK